MNSKRFLMAFVAAAIVAAGAGLSFALDVDQNRNTVAREFRDQQITYYRITVNYNDPRISTAQKFGKLKKDAFITNVACHVLTAFNAGTTNVFTVGTSTTANEIINAGSSNQSIDETSATYQNVSSSGGLGEGVTSAADVDLYARYTQTGTAATAGKVTCVIAFIQNDDM